MGSTFLKLQHTQILQGMALLHLVLSLKITFSSIHNLNVPVASQSLAAVTFIK